MILKDKVVLITGACGGIGSALVNELVNRNVKKIYAADLNIEHLSKLKEQYGDVIFPVVLNVTLHSDIVSCNEKCGDIDVLVNNAGLKINKDFFKENAAEMAGVEMNVNCIGMYSLSRLMIQKLRQKESSAIVNILSIASFSYIKDCPTYCASKSAANMITHAMRQELKNTSVDVFAVYPGYVDTDMTKDTNIEKVTPQSISLSICDSIEGNIEDIFPDPMSRELAKKVEYIPHYF